MHSPENRVIAVAALATLAGLALLAVVELTVTLPGDWHLVLGFAIILTLGFLLPQFLLLTRDPSVPRRTRLGLLTVIILLLAAGFSASLSGTELLAIWTLVGLTLATIILLEFREGYHTTTTLNTD